ncbi:MAG: tetratricopeptide repeat protein [Lachnospiraceae bacterium]|nr:tetratricopeptide repeat protein [Lachnospiraceae bacterium]
MRCYRCNAPLSDTEDFCTQCGADVTVYRRVAKTSNSYYNKGLAKAQVRDLSGAADCLKTSLRLNKRNINARNLLGLVYCEMGEVVEALAQWAISKNIKPEMNIASVFIKKIQADQNQFDELSQSIQKYNLALHHAQTGNFDLAEIQLKKILTQNVKFVKAEQLLALLYCRKEDYARAKKCLKHTLKVDRSNTLSQRYLAEIETLEYELSKENVDTFLPSRKKKKNNQVDVKPLNGNDVIMPSTTYKEPANGAITVIDILIGVVIGAAIIWFLIMPARLQSKMQEYNENLNEYTVQLSNSNSEIEVLKSQLAQLEAKNKELEDTASNSGVSNANAAVYEALLAAAYNYINADQVAAAEGILALNSEELTGTAETNLYNKIKSDCFAPAATALYEAGEEYYNDKEYTKAIDSLERSYKLNGESVETIYYLAQSYAALKENTKAKTYYQLIVDQYPDSFYVTEASAFIKAN